MALDWKVGYADGALTTWSRSDVVELMLDWCPRKVSSFDDGWQSIPRWLVAFLQFLRDAELRHDGDSLTKLLRAIDAATPEFLRAMVDPPDAGLARSLIALARADGVDVSDPSSLEQWISDWNARPEEQRKALQPLQASPSSADARRHPARRGDHPCLGRRRAVLARSGVGEAEPGVHRRPRHAAPGPAPRPGRLPVRRRGRRGPGPSSRPSGSLRSPTRGWPRR